MRKGTKMNFGPLINRLDKTVTLFNQGLAWLAGLALTLMLMLIVANALIRIFYHPFPGTTELVGWLAAITTSFALGYTQLHNGNVALNMLTKRFPLGIQKILEGIFSLCTALFFGMAGWKIVSYGFTLKNSGYLSETLRIAYYPIVVVMSLGFLGLTLTLLLDLIKLAEGDVQGGS